MKIKIERKVEQVSQSSGLFKVFASKKDTIVIYLTIIFTEEETTVLKDPILNNRHFFTRPYHVSYLIPTGESWGDQHEARIEVHDLLFDIHLNHPTLIAYCHSEIKANAVEKELREALVALKRVITHYAKDPEGSSDYEL